jgi:hypothetical protein
MFKKPLLTSCISVAILISSQAAFAQESEQKTSAFTDDDIALIETKKDALLYLLMEKGELEPLIQELRSQQQSQKAEKEMQQAFPYTEEQIKKRRELTLDYERAQNAPVKSKVVNISEKDYDPDGRTPISLRVAANNPSSIAFFDYQGNPWPIVGDVIGNTEAFDSYPFSESKNTAVFQIKKRFSETVALVNLQGINQLVVIKLVGDEGEFDARKNIRIPRRGPLSIDTVTNMGSDVSNSDPLLIRLLNGESLPDGIEYESNWDDESKFVRVGNILYIRTKDSITYPPRIAGQQSANGYNLYKIDFSNTIIIEKDGQHTILTLNKKRGHKQ